MLPVRTQSAAAGQSLALLLLGLIFLMILDRGVIYPVEKGAFALAVLVVFALNEVRVYRYSRGFHWFSWKHWYCTLPLVFLAYLLWLTFNVSIFPWDSLLRVMEWFSAVLLFYVSYSLGRRPERKHFLVSGILLLAQFFAIHALLIYFGVLEQNWWEKAEFLSGTFVNHNHFAGFLESILFLQIFRTVSANSDRRPLEYLKCLLLGLCLILSMSRGAWLSVIGTGLILGVLLLFHKTMRPMALKVWAGLLTVFLALFLAVSLNLSPALNQRIESFTHSEGQFEFMDFRVKLWQSTLAAIETSPWFGHGPRSFEWAMLPYRQGGFEFSFDYAHHDWLQITMETGILGLGLLLIFFLLLSLRVLSRFLSLRLQEFRQEDLGLWLGLVCLALHGLTDFNLHIFANLHVLAMICGLLVPSSDQKSRDSGRYREQEAS